MVPEKTRLSLTAHRALNGGFSAPKDTETIVLLSGECSWQFKFKLISIERISMLFEELFPGKKVATDNLQTEPRNVTLGKFKKKKRM